MPRGHNFFTFIQLTKLVLFGKIVPVSRMTWRDLNIRRSIEVVITGRTRNPLGYTVTIPSQMAEACGFKRGSNLVFTPLSSGFSSHF